VSLKLFAWTGFELRSLLITASWVARITGMSHWCPAFHELFTQVGLKLRSSLSQPSK
jgi:hypothetical protein